MKIYPEPITFWAGEPSLLKVTFQQFSGHPPLAERIKRGPIPVEESLGIAKQIAEALEAAHESEKAIIHRDLKLANVKITPDGKVKVLDFGLAKALASEPSPGVSRHLLPEGEGLFSDSPTLLSAAGTQKGVILGTAAYMSPEQAKGMTVDRRTDIFAFGAVLYEMLTGRQAFRGDSLGDILAAVIRAEPDWSRLPSDAPPSIHKLLRLCLQKDVKKRRQTAADVRIDIEQALAEPVAAQLVATPARSWQLAWIVAAGAVLVVSVLAIPGLQHLRETPPLEPVLRYTLGVPENGTLHSMAVSPDGRYVAIAAEVQGERQLWLLALDAAEAEALPGTADATFPFWSPDSRNIGFFAQGKLKRIAASGGPPLSLCDVVVNGRGGSWNREDVILFSPSNAGGIAIQRCPAAGGIPSDVTRTKGNYLFPVFLPDGRHFLYAVVQELPDKDGIYLSSLDGSENRRVLPDVSSVVFALPPFRKRDRSSAVHSGKHLDGPTLRCWKRSDRGRCIFRC